MRQVHTLPHSENKISWTLSKAYSSRLIRTSSSSSVSIVQGEFIGFWPRTRDVIYISFRDKDGGVFVHFNYDASSSPSNGASPLEDIRQVMQSKARQSGGLPSWLGLRMGDVWIVRGEPWTEVREPHRLNKPNNSPTAKRTCIDTLRQLLKWSLRGPTFTKNRCITHSESVL